MAKNVIKYWWNWSFDLFREYWYIAVAIKVVEVIILLFMAGKIGLYVYSVVSP